MSQKTCILAYSGGLDTSVVIKWLQENYKVAVIATVFDVGQDKTEDLKFIEKKALDIGAYGAQVIDLREEFANNYISKAIKANGLYENKYPLVSALSRPLMVKHLVDQAHARGADFIAHGCTGKGNDQVRFDVACGALDPSLQVLAPVREWDLLTRADEIAYAAEHGIPIPVTQDRPYSVDDNLFGRTIECGILEDPWVTPPEDIFGLTNDPAGPEAPDTPQEVTLTFEAGLPVALDGEEMELLPLIGALTDIGGLHGCGRIDMIENRLVGLKSHEIYEVPAALALLTAHKALEDICLDRDTAHFKLDLEHKWADLVYDGLWYSPLKAALDSFIDATQKTVSGEVRLQYFKGAITVCGRRSPYALYDFKLATYDQGDSFNRDAAKGFIEIHGLPLRTWSSLHSSII
ncbi:MAG: argininosuccinate synthase [Coriobacteriia bacterium]|nr:argininosuccinate synthase [Coriobacteriia bacterium]